MSRAASTIVLAFLLVLPGPTPSAGTEEDLARAREEFVHRDEPERSRAAVDAFLRIARQDPGSHEARWEGARAIYYHGRFTLEDAPKKERLELFRTGIDLAKEAIALRPDRAEAHFWLGVLYGVYGETKGIFKSLSLVKPLRAQMDICLTLDRSVEAWGPDRLLGRMYFKLPWWKGGDNDKSIEHLERSLEKAPTNALTRLYLAEVYKAEKRKAEAIELSRSILEMAPDPRWAPEHPWIVRDAERLLRKLE